ncbi:MAG: hypothetical protein KAU20_02270 [Nanoarchaeota archaeon]|nr:hypothetical protein [Nanoarchaeota archaeon]
MRQPQSFNLNKGGSVSDEISKAKVKLYSLLLQKDVDDLTQPEVSTMYDLATDPDIQKVLAHSMKENEDAKN